MMQLSEPPASAGADLLEVVETQQISDSARTEVRGSLSGLVIAFDLDNTLLDPSGEAYRSTVTEFLGHLEVPLAGPQAHDEYEQLRTQGEALERLGLRNPNHERGNADALAVFCVTSGVGRGWQEVHRADPRKSAEFRGFVDRLAELDAATRRGCPQDRLDAELVVRRFLITDDRTGRFVFEVHRVADLPVIRKWAARYPEIERRQPLNDVRPLVRELSDLGATVVIITEGRILSQKEKVARLGLTEMLDERVLISEAAGRMPDGTAFRIRLEELFGSHLHRGDTSPSAELASLWKTHCLHDAWSRKTPAFYARCLHAIQANPHRCEEELVRRTLVPSDEWSRRPLKFVMVGDRYESDVLPLIQLLGPAVGLRVRLAQGKYGHLNRDADLAAELRPDRTFADWATLTNFLTNDLRGSSIQPIHVSPYVLP